MNNRSTRPAHAAAVTGFGLATLSALVPAGSHEAVSNLATVVMAIALVAVCVAYGRSSAWRLIAGALALWAVADLVYGTSWSVARGLLVSDVLYIAGVLSIVLGIRRMVIERGTGGARDDLLDAATVGAAACVVVWQLFVLNASTEGPTLARVVQLFYPFSDAMLLALLAWLAFTPGLRARSTQLLVSFFGLVLVADVLWAVLPTHLSLLAHVADPLYTLAYGVLVAAAAHPSAVDVAAPAEGAVARINPARMGFVGVAMVATPFAAALAASGGSSGAVGRSTGGRWPLLGLTVGAASLVAARVSNLFRQNLRAERQLREQGRRDPVTGLGNRTALVEVLEYGVHRAAVRGMDAFLLFIDLDRFKAVNDAFGHPTGDELLRQVADRLRAALPDALVISRFGGDEFALVIRGADSDFALSEARRLHAALVEQYVLGTTVVSVGASIGVGMCQAGTSVAALLRDTDAAMYKAKHGHGDPVQLCDEALQSVAARREHIAQGLARSMTLGHLSVVYQPIVRVAAAPGAADRLFGFEALARYVDPTLGPVSPLEFIAVAEGSGLIDEVGQWILDEACRTLAEMNERRESPVQMWVNLSARQLEREGVADDVASVLARHRVAPSLVSLEITESTLMRDSLAVGGALSELSALGVDISLDDFGTGSSSLSYLNRLPFTSIKVDRSFVESMDSATPERSAVAGLLSLASTMGCRTVVEGIETEEQAESLRRIGASLAQGYLFARPMVRSDALALAAVGTSRGDVAPAGPTLAGPTLAGPTLAEAGTR